mmetsp:Transcript_46704/g.99911  ORF Transcript_46704/g.99911 Transcript_46704/m.99911 type:complete len:226 (+) Transcript_46704:932-1609(+)
MQLLRLRKFDSRGLLHVLQLLDSAGTLLDEGLALQHKAFPSLLEHRVSLEDPSTPEKFILESLKERITLHDTPPQSRFLSTILFASFDITSLHLSQLRAERCDLLVQTLNVVLVLSVGGNDTLMLDIDIRDFVGVNHLTKELVLHGADDILHLDEVFRGSGQGLVIRPQLVLRLTDEWRRCWLRFLVRWRRSRAMVEGTGSSTSTDLSPIVRRRRHARAGRIGRG